MFKAGAQSIALGGRLTQGTMGAGLRAVDGGALRVLEAGPLQNLQSALFLRCSDLERCEIQRQVNIVGQSGLGPRKDVGGSPELTFGDELGSLGPQRLYALHLGAVFAIHLGQRRVLA